MYKVLFKQLFDFAFAAILILPLCALILIVAPFIFFDDPGPVFYMGKRLGRNGKIFLMYKFRSMKINSPDIRNADGSTYNSDNDIRLTRVGRKLRKFSIDEVPQIINVLKGEMSFIGPRPNIPNAMKIYNPYEKKRMGVRPGISGYSQALFRNSKSLQDRYDADLYYIENISFLFDLKIFFITLWAVIKKRNINQC